MVEYAALQRRVEDLEAAGTRVVLAFLWDERGGLEQAINDLAGELGMHGNG